MTLMADSSDVGREAISTKIVNEEELCPTCGKPFDEFLPPVSLRPADRSPWPWVLVAVGLYLVLVFRGQALRDSAFLPSPDLQAACAQPPPIRSVNPKLCERFVQDRLLFEHDEAAVAVGGVVLLLGVVRLVRQCLAVFRFSGLAARASLTERPHRWQFLALALGVWAFAENLLLLGLQCLLLIAGATLIAWVANGTSISVDLVNAAIKKAVDAAFDLRLMVS